MTVIVGATTSVTWTPGGTGAATVAVRLPDGTTLDPAPTVTGSSGAYTAPIVTTQPGRHLVSWSRDVDRSVDILDVWPPDPRYIISIADALAVLGNIPVSRQGDLALHVATATYVIERLAGPVISEERTWRADGGRGAVVLPSCPVQVVTVSVSGTLLDPADYDVDPDAGIVYAAFAAGRPRNVVITYRVGAAVIPANLREAAQRLTKHLVTSGRQPGSGGAQAPAPDLVATPFGFAVPAAVVELCALTPAAPGFA